MDKFKSRKLVVFLVAFFMASIFLAEQMLTGQEWVDFAKWSLLAYAGGNVGEHFATR